MLPGMTSFLILHENGETFLNIKADGDIVGQGGRFIGRLNDKEKEVFEGYIKAVNAVTSRLVSPEDTGMVH